MKNNYKKIIQLKLNTTKKNININVILNQFNINPEEFKIKFTEISNFIKKNLLIDINLIIFKNNSFEIKLKELNWKILLKIIEKNNISLLEIFKIILLKKNKVKITKLKLNQLRNKIKCY